MILHAMRLASALITSSTTHQVLYTCPSGYRVILRSFAATNRSVTAGSCYLYLPEPNQVFRQTLAARSNAGDSFEWRPWLVLYEGESVASIVASGVQAQVLLSGSIYFV
jgi:hypothetical protein